MRFEFLDLQGCFGELQLPEVQIPDYKLDLTVFSRRT
jgi:hypothetical protein